MRYALIIISNGLVENVIELDEPVEWEIPEGYQVVRSDAANIGDTYLNGEFIAPVVLEPDPDPVQVAIMARYERSRQLRDIYDSGTQMVRRELDMTSDAARTTLLKAKLMELHAYANALQAIPEQPGFPLEIVWPTIPSETLE